MTSIIEWSSVQISTTNYRHLISKIHFEKFNLISFNSRINTLRESGFIDLIDLIFDQLPTYKSSDDVNAVAHCLKETEQEAIEDEQYSSNIGFEHALKLISIYLWLIVVCKFVLILEIINSNIRERFHSFKIKPMQSSPSL